MELLGRMVSSSIFSFFDEIPYSFSQWLHQVTFPLSVYKGSLFSTFSLVFVIYGFFDDSHPDRCQVVSCGFDLLFSEN